MKVLIPTVSEFKEKYELPKSFPHQAPDGYEYRTIQFKRSVISIWIVHQRGFIYNDHRECYCIWGFYDTKKQCYYAPVNSKQIGEEVDISSTTPYSAMQLKLNPLEYAFLHS